VRQKIDWFKSWTGKSIDDISRSFQNDFTSYWEVKSNSKYEPIELGRDPEIGSPFYISLEQLKHHFRMLGATQLGKSMLALYFMMKIIVLTMLSDYPQGIFLVDPSASGDTSRKLLGFCESIDFKKVLVIDLNETKNPVINPFHKDKYATVNNLDDAFQVLFSVKDSADTPNIAKYLPAIMHILWNAGLTIAEAQHFTLPLYEIQQQYILRKSEQAEKKQNLTPHHRRLIETAIEPKSYDRFVSTTSRLEQLNHPAIQALFGAKSTVHLARLIKEGWVISLIANSNQLSQLQRRSVVTILINEVIYAIESLCTRGWNGRFYLLIDEAGQYCTRKLAEVLDLKSKIGLTVGIMHQDDSQFDDPQILGSVRKNCKNRFFFGKDAIQLIKTEVPQQEMAVELNGISPFHLRVPDIMTYDPSQEFFNELRANPIYRERATVLQEFAKRIPYIASDSGVATDGTPSELKSDNPSDLPTSRWESIERVQSSDESLREIRKKRSGKKNNPGEDGAVSVDA